MLWLFARLLAKKCTSDASLPRMIKTAGRPNENQGFATWRRETGPEIRSFSIKTAGIRVAELGDGPD
jgi:hypothetical protein